jgi:hypothetical protein
MKNAAQPFKHIITAGQPPLDDLKSIKAIHSRFVRD